jgi:hypothetical protein
MTDQAYSPNRHLGQPDGCGLDRSSEIDELAWSAGGDHPVPPAVLRIEQENADAARRATIPPPAVISTDCGDVADAPPSCFETAPVSPDVTGNAIASDKRGRAIIKRIMRPFFRTQERHGAPRPKRASVKPSRRRRCKPERKRRGPRQIEVGWTRFNQFPSSMGRKVAPGECNFASSAALMVAVIGPKHDQQTGSIRTVRSVSTGKVTTVVLGALVETHERVPISFYKFRRTSPSTPEAIAVRS